MSSCLSSLFHYNPTILTKIPTTPPSTLPFPSKIPPKIFHVPTNYQQNQKKWKEIPSISETNPRSTSVTTTLLDAESIKWQKVVTQSLLLSYLISFFQEHVVTTLHKLIAPPLHPSVDPEQVFVGNYAPVEELEPTNCLVVKGEIPTWLSGVYIRNGSNPQHKYDDSPIHFFEGDGMLHSLKLSNGQATYCSRYVKTYKYLLERDAGSPIFPNMLTGLHRIKDVVGFFVVLWRIISGQINVMRGFGIAITNIALFSNKLLALGESDLPYIIQLTQQGDINTIGRWEFNNKLFANMTAHPRVDTDTSEAFSYRYSPFYPYITYFRFDSCGTKQGNDVPFLSVKEPCFIHDFSITNRFAVFPDTSMVVKPMKMVLGRGMPMMFEPNKVPRIGVIPKYATSDSHMKWFQVPGFNAMHVINAWDQGEDEIVLIAPNILNIENIFQSIDRVHLSLEKLVINLSTGHVSRMTNFSKSSLEFGSINPNYYGKKNRYVYLGIGDVIPKMVGAVKIDLENGCEVSRRIYGPHCFGGEPLFVPREAINNGDLKCDKEKNSDNNNNNLVVDEDDGYLVTYLHNENSGESSFLVMDAKSPELQDVAIIRLPRRVPYGFHGTFMSDKNL